MAVQIIIDVPSGNASGALFDKESMPLSSLAIAFPILTAVRPPSASIIISSGTEITGFLKSFGIGFTSGNATSGSDGSSGSDNDSCCSTLNSSITSSFSTNNGSDTFGVTNF